jgi:phosphohistidine phosphatase
MKQLFVIRHAKSSWEIAAQSDFDRPLNERGHRDAPQMAQRLLKAGISIEMFVSSPAVRALTTAQYFAEAFDFKKKDIITIDRLYHASAETFFDVIANELKDKWDRVAIFSHNPGITYFANSLGVVELDNMPTCGVMGVKADIQSWKDFAKARKELLLFDYPKKHT